MKELAIINNKFLENMTKQQNKYSQKRKVKR